MRLSELNEGLVKHVDRLKSQVRDFVLSTMIGRLLDNVPDKATRNVVLTIVNQYYPGIVPTTRKTQTFRSPTIEEVPIQYQRFYKQAATFWESVGPLKVRCHFKPSNLFVGGAEGYYSYTYNKIDINCSFVDTEFDYDKLAKLMSTVDTKRASVLITSWLDRLMTPVAVAYHELTHYIQYSFLMHGHTKQVDQRTTSTRVDYWTSNIEIPAQIEGFAEVAGTWVKKYKRYFPKVSCMLYGRYLVGDMSVSEFSHETNIDQKYIPTVRNGGVIAFFRDIKKHRPSMYPKAVTYFMRRMLNIT